MLSRAAQGPGSSVPGSCNQPSLACCCRSRLCHTHVTKRAFIDLGVAFLRPRSEMRHHGIKELTVISVHDGVRGVAGFQEHLLAEDATRFSSSFPDVNNWLLRMAKFLQADNINTFEDHDAVRRPDRTALDVAVPLHGRVGLEHR